MVRPVCQAAAAVSFAGLVALGIPISLLLTIGFQVVWWRFPRSTWETFKASADGKKFRDLRDPVETAAYMWLPVLRFLTRWLRKVWKFGVAALCFGLLVAGVVAMTGNSCAN